MTTIEHTMTWRVTFRPPVPLSKVGLHPELKIRGVYFLLDGPSDGPHNPYSSQVIYIGKAIGETIFSRGRKHLDTMTGARFANGNPKTGNSKAFKRYRERSGFNVDQLWFVAGEMDQTHPYLISCAETYFIHEFHRRHGYKPVCNTAG